MIKPQMNRMFPRAVVQIKMEARARSNPEYHSNRWTRESREFRRANPLCRKCESKGIIRASEVTDHIVPVAIHPDFWDRSNWQPLCKTCNIEKGNQDKQLINRYHNENR